MSPRSSARRGGACEAGCGPSAEAVESRVSVVELSPVAVGALQVVADDLVLLDEHRVPVEPAGEGFVKLRSGLLRQRVVGGVPDQEVAEAECLVVGRGPAGRGGSAPSGRARGGGRERRRARWAVPAPARRRGGRPGPRRRRGRSCRARPVPSRSSRDCRSAWIVGGTTISLWPSSSLTAWQASPR